MKTVAVIQSNYIPWKGYFDIIHDVDTFIFYDDVQFTKNSWRNRNKIKSSNGTNWISIPVGTDLNRLICEVAISDRRWQEKHWKTIEQFYKKTSYFKLYKDFFSEIYLDQTWENLSELNQHLVKRISTELLGIKTKFEDSRSYQSHGTKTDRLVEVLTKAGANIYLSGPAAESYMNENLLRENGIILKYKNYAGYPEYPQLYPPFQHDVSIIDLLFNVGPETPYYIWGWREK